MMLSGVCERAGGRGDASAKQFCYCFFFLHCGPGSRLSNRNRLNRPCRCAIKPAWHVHSTAVLLRGAGAHTTRARRVRVAATPRHWQRPAGVRARWRAPRRLGDAHVRRHLHDLGVCCRDVALLRGWSGRGCEDRREQGRQDRQGHIDQLNNARRLAPALWQRPHHARGAAAPGGGARVPRVAVRQLQRLFLNPDAGLRLCLGRGHHRRDLWRRRRPRRSPP